MFDPVELGRILGLRRDVEGVKTKFDWEPTDMDCYRLDVMVSVRIPRLGEVSTHRFEDEMLGADLKFAIRWSCTVGDDSEGDEGGYARRFSCVGKLLEGYRPYPSHTADCARACMVQELFMANYSTFFLAWDKLHLLNLDNVLGTLMFHLVSSFPIQTQPKGKSPTETLHHRFELTRLRIIVSGVKDTAIFSNDCSKG